ncbi:MAG TPA: UDP-N-acetylmuramoyl-tripeptide--D-alanyl-D-alanine ligase [Methylomirabilota bacterium]|nr:UDP-N-acetylmuramoyl-tripeptide--D-alanyl-D-alanine ligase [Methylomirabilota bacterium]
MEPLSIEFLAASCGGELARPTPGLLVQRICSDTRALQPGDLFVALRGENFDGHNFLNEAYSKGAVAFLVERQRLPSDFQQSAIIVEDCRSALGKIAARYRATLPTTVIAVAGSNGKTTSKELIAGTLRSALKIHASQASFNNDIGVPLTLLGLDASHQAAVVEIGTNHPGELEPLARMAQPQIGVITSIGREHLEFFHDLKGVAQEEGALAEVIPASGKLFINGDSPELESIIRRARCEVIRCGAGEQNDWRCSDVSITASGTEFQVHSPTSRFNGRYTVNLLGAHMAVNALFALAIAASLGLTPEQAREGLSQAQGAKMRLQVVQTPEFLILNDAYNANADSMAAAVETLAQYPASGRRVAVLGDMGELGSAAADSHLEIGKRVANAGVDLLIAVGRWSGVVAEAARASGLQQVQAFRTVEDVAPVFRQSLRTGDTILVKASRSARLERLVETLSGK